MKFSEVFKIFTILNFGNKIRFLLFSTATFVFRLTGKRIFEKIKIRFFGIGYYVHVGLGEINTIFYTNILQDYSQLNRFVPSSKAICLDVGANIGSTSLNWTKHINGGKIFAIEPHPQTFSMLQENIELNKADKKILPRQIAISKNDKDIALFVSDEGTMAMKPGNYKWKGKEISVPSMSLDSFVRNERIDMIDILKIDIEGYEAEALEGASKTLKHTKRVVLEYHSAELRMRCRKILEQNGFKIHERGPLIFSWKS